MFFSAWRVNIYLEGVTPNSSQFNTSQFNNMGIPHEIWVTRVGVFAIGGTAIACFGLLCNSISIVVLANFRQKSSAPFLLICLEVVDSVLLLSEMVLETLATLSQATLIADSYRDFIRPFYVVTYPIPHIAQTGITMLTVLITLERYVAVAKPLLASTVCSKTWARRGVLVILLWSLLFHVPLYMAYTSDYQFHPQTDTTRIVFHRTEFGRSRLYNYWFIVWINLVFEFLIPFVIIVVFNFLMLKALRASRSLTSSSGKGGNTKHGGKLTGMMIAVTVIFFVCELFPAVALIIIRGKDVFAECSVACAHFVSVADTMVLLNSAVNFVAYCAIGKQFRDLFFRIFLRSQSQPSSPHGPATPLKERQCHSGNVGLDEKKVPVEPQQKWVKEDPVPGSSGGGGGGGGGSCENNQNGHRFLHLDLDLHRQHHQQHYHHQSNYDGGCGEWRGGSTPTPTRL